jgi:beta-glucosidase
MLVSEHGINSIDDDQRMQHLEQSLVGLRSCLAEGLSVLGYIHWSLIDNFEWRSGYGPRFGLYEVNRTTFERRPKPSAARYRDLIKAAHAQV